MSTGQKIIRLVFGLMLSVFSLLLILNSIIVALIYQGHKNYKAIFDFHFPRIDISGFSDISPELLDRLIFIVIFVAIGIVFLSIGAKLLFETIRLTPSSIYIRQKGKSPNRHFDRINDYFNWESGQMNTLPPSTSSSPIPPAHIKKEPNQQLSPTPKVAPNTPVTQVTSQHSTLQPVVSLNPNPKTSLTSIQTTRHPALPSHPTSQTSPRAIDTVNTNRPQPTTNSETVTQTPHPPEATSALFSRLSNKIGKLKMNYQDYQVKRQLQSKPTAPPKPKQSLPPVKNIDIENLTKSFKTQASKEEIKHALSESKSNPPTNKKTDVPKTKPDKSPEMSAENHTESQKADIPPAKSAIPKKSLNIQHDKLTGLYKKMFPKIDTRDPNWLQKYKDF